MAGQVFVTKTDDLHLIPVTHIAGGEAQYLQVILTFVPWRASLNKHTNKCNEKF